MKFWLVGLLRVAWVAGTLPIIIASLPSSRLHLFHEALMGFAKRGKIMHSSSYVSDHFSLILKFVFSFCLGEHLLICLVRK